MHAHDVCAAGDGDGDGGRGAFDALVGRQIQSVADERLAAGSGQDREAQAAQLAQPVEQLQVLRHGLAEADARIEDDAFGRDAGTPRQVDADLQLGRDVGDQVVVVRAHVAAAQRRVDADVLALAAVVHQHCQRAGPGRHLGDARLQAKAPHVVDNAGAGGQRRLGHRRLGGVDGDGHVHRAHQVADDRQHAPQLLVGVNRLRAGPGALAADVQNVCTFGHKTASLGNCGIDPRAIAAVCQPVAGETVRGRVDDAHDVGLAAPGEWVVADTECCGEHGDKVTG